MYPRTVFENWVLRRIFVAEKEHELIGDTFRIVTTWRPCVT